MKTKNPFDIFEMARKGKPGCLFCSPIEGMEIDKTDNFRILIDTFPVIPGHIMISSIAHYGSAGELPSFLQGEMQALKNDLQNKVQSLNGSYIFYEHGRARCCLKASPDGNKCEHFHLHCLSVDITIRKGLEKRFECIEMKEYGDIFSLSQQFGHYLYFEEFNGSKLFFLADDDKVESHLLRSMICHTIGVPERSDWESFTNPLPFVKSYELVENLIYNDEELYHGVS